MELFEYEERLQKLSEFFKYLPSEPSGRFWWDGAEILCRNGGECEAVAYFIDELCGEAVTHTGYYDPTEDERNGEVDDHTGYFYIDWD